MRSTAALVILVVVSARGLAHHGAERLPSARSRGVLDGRHLRRSLNALYNLRGGNAPVLDATEPIDIETELELEEALEEEGEGTKRSPIGNLRAPVSPFLPSQRVVLGCQLVWRSV